MNFLKKRIPISSVSASYACPEIRTEILDDKSPAESVNHTQSTQEPRTASISLWLKLHPGYLLMKFAYIIDEYK